MPAVQDLVIETNAPLPTWFKVGGGADRFARPRSVEDLKRALEIDPALRVLGDGTNLLVDDDGVGELVVSLGTGAFRDVRWEDGGNAGLTYAGAGANLPMLVVESVRRGLAGLEGLGGIPASLGGALVMNAGGTFGQIADAVVRVFALRRDGTPVTLERSEIPFGYRTSGLKDLIITGADLRLFPSDPAKLRDRLKEVMAYKKGSQPMADNSAGCCFKNPTLAIELKDIAPAGQRVSAGMLIDKAGLKGLKVGGAEVSQRHGNFIVTNPGAKARDVIDLMGEVTRRVHAAFGVTLEPEVVVWRRKREA